jgi:hypothetical protein
LDDEVVWAAGGGYLAGTVRVVVLAILGGEDIGGSGSIHFRFFAKKHRRFTLCFSGLLQLLGHFEPYFLGVFWGGIFAFFWAF